MALDWKQQLLAERAMMVLCGIVSVISWVIGFLYDDIVLGMTYWLIGFAIVGLATVPDWSVFVSSSIKWRSSIPKEDVDFYTKPAADAGTSSS